MVVLAKSISEYSGHSDNIATFLLLNISDKHPTVTWADLANFIKLENGKAEKIFWWEINLGDEEWVTLNFTCFSLFYISEGDLRSNESLKKGSSFNKPLFFKLDGCPKVPASNNSHFIGQSIFESWNPQC